MPRRELAHALILLAAAALALLGAALSSDPAPRWVCIALTLLLAGALASSIYAALRRQRLLARLAARVNALAVTPRAPSATGISGVAEAPGAAPRTARDAERALRDAVQELAARVARQVKELAKKTANLEALIDGLPEPVIVTGAMATVILNNAAAERMLASPPGGLLGRGLSEVITRPELLALHEDARSGRARRDQFTLTTPGGPRIFEVAASPLPAAWGVGVFGAVLVLRDISELARAVQRQKDFVASASHELRTPVAALRAAIETLQDAGAEDAAMSTRLLEISAAHVQRLQDMVQDLLDLSRAEARDVEIKPALIDWPRLQRGLHELYDDAAAERRIRLHLAIDPALAGVSIDPSLLQLIVRNLVDNAVKFAHENTIINARLTRPAHARLRIEVQDRGPGIPLAQQPRVFERFFQVDTARTGVTGRRGSGLGLAIVKHATLALGGEIGLDSVYGTGTTVWVELPIA
ncbi:ATP-binding protein [soil metagenome]